MQANLDPERHGNAAGLGATDPLLLLLRVDAQEQRNDDGHGAAGEGR